jgi:large subunit ribosomal protein L22
MEWQAKHRFARISPSKARLIIDLIRGRNVQDAMNILKFTPNRASGMISKVLKSAVATAAENEADAEELVVSEARIDPGPVMKRFQPKDRGRAHPILKRTCHIIVGVGDQNQDEEG